MMLAARMWLMMMIDNYPCCSVVIDPVVTETGLRDDGLMMMMMAK
jgi:hypothetical protein